jgi:two-component system NtrC family sensor kinase
MVDLQESHKELQSRLERQTTELREAKRLLSQAKAKWSLAEEALRRSESERQEVEESLRQQTEYLAALHETALGLASQEELTDLLQAIVERAGKLLGTQHGYICLHELSEGAMVMQIGTGVYRNHCGRRLKPGEGLPGRVWRQGHPLVVSDYRTWPHRALDPGLDSLRYAVGIPLKSGSRVIGVLGLAHTQENEEFGYDEIAVLSQFAALATIAFDNWALHAGLQQELNERKRAEEALQLRNRELALLNQTGRAFSSTLNLEQVLAILLEEIRHLLDITACSVWLIDAQADELVCEQVSGPKNDIVRGWRLAMGQGLAGWAASHGETLVVPDAQIDDRHYKEVDQRTGLALKSIVSIPLRIKADVIGVLQVMDTKVDAFGPAELRLLEPLAASAAFAIQNARLYKQAHQEIIERRRAEMALRASEEKYRLLFESSPESITLVSLDGILLDCNKATAEISGLPREELIGKPFTELGTLSERDLSRYSTLLAQLARGGEIAPLEVEIIHGSGEPRWLEVVATLIEEHSGVGAIQVITRDVTERKLIEQVLLRTERLAAMGHLAAALAHEINNPLQAISSNLELALDFPIPEQERQEYLKAVRQEIKRLMGLTSRVLDFARPPRIERQSISIVDAVRYALALAGKQLAHKHIEVSLDLCDGLPPVRASRDQLTQVFLNLIINASEAMPKGGKLHISAQVLDRRLEIAFADSGSGIPPGERSKLFEPFHTTKDQGTGLGLTVSYSIVQQHGGTITVENAPGGGAIFTVALPLAPLDHLEPKKEES